MPSQRSRRASLGLGRAEHQSSMAKGPREKVGGTQSKAHWAKEQRLKDREARVAVKKGGGHQAMHAEHHKEEAEAAELVSYKLNKRSKF